MGLGWYRRGSGIFIFLSLLILTLAALTKTTAGVYLLSILALLIYHHLFKKRNFKMVLLYLLSGLFLLSLIAWYDYQYVYQRNIELWSTLFLSETQMPESAAVVQRIFESIWLFLPEYMNVVQWSILLMGIALMFGIKFLSKHWLLISLFSTGALAIFLLFGKQFIYHDYYVIAPYLPIAIGIQMLTVKQAGLFMRRTALSLLLLVLAVISFSLGSSRAFARMSERTTLKGSAQLNETTWLENAGNWFSDHTKQSSKVFVVYEMEPNLALVYLNRTGIVFNEEEMGRDTSNFYYWLERRKPEYILCRRQNQIEFYKEHADFYQSCNLSFESEEFIILKPHGY
jgi:hypothetical protein